MAPVVGGSYDGWFVAQGFFSKSFLSREAHSSHSLRLNELSSVASPCVLCFKRARAFFSLRKKVTYAGKMFGGSWARKKQKLGFPHFYIVGAPFSYLASQKKTKTKRHFCFLWFFFLVGKSNECRHSLCEWKKILRLKGKCVWIAVGYRYTQKSFARRSSKVSPKFSQFCIAACERELAPKKSLLKGPILSVFAAKEIPFD